MLRLLADENLDYDLVRGALRLRPTLDFVRVQDVGLSGVNDPAILVWAAQEGRVVLTHDVKTMIRFAFDRISSGLSMAYIYDAGRFVTIKCKYEDGKELEVTLRDRVNKCDYRIDGKRALSLACK